MPKNNIAIEEYENKITKEVERKSRQKFSRKYSLSLYSFFWGSLGNFVEGKN